MRQAFILAFSLAAVLVGAPARATDNPACAKYEEPLAYNACLARFGPPAPGIRGAPATEGEGEPPRAYIHRSAHSSFEGSRTGRGRMRMEFDVSRRRRP